MDEAVKLMGDLNILAINAAHQNMVNGIDKLTEYTVSRIDVEESCVLTAYHQ